MNKFTTFCSRMLLLVAMMMPFALHADELTVNDGTRTNSYVPFYGYYGDTPGTHSQFILSAESLADLTGATFSSFKFYSSANSANWGSATWAVKMMEVEAATFSSFYSMADAPTVYDGALTIEGGELLITFESEYLYEGGNLLVEVALSQDGGDTQAAFYGVQAPSGTARYATNSYNTTGSAQSTTIEYTPAAGGNCARPGAISLDNLTATGASFSWGAVEGATAYQCLCLPKDAEADWDAALTVSANAMAVMGLLPNTQYTFYVRTYCGEEGTSSVRKANFRTDCAAITAETWSEDFDGSVDFACWVLPTGVTHDYSQNTVDNTTKGLKFVYGANNSVVVLPDFGNLNGKRMRFSYCNMTNSYSTVGGKFHLGYVTNADPSTFVALLSPDRNEEAAEVFVEVHYTDVPADAQPAIKYYDAATYSLSVQLDNLQISPIPTCFPGSNIHVDSVSLHSVSLSWDAASCTEDYHLILVNGNDTLFNGAVNGTSYTLDSLESSHIYTLKAYLYGVCDGVDSQDAAIQKLTFATECAVITDADLPWSEGFEDWNYQDMPVCWTKISNNNYPYVGTTAFESNRSMYFYGGGASSPQYLVFPEVDIDFAGHELRFNYRSAEGDTYGTLRLGAMTDPTDPSTFVEWVELPQTGTTFDFYRYELDEVPSMVHYIALCYTGGTYNYASAYVDNIAIVETPSCNTALSLSVEETAENSVTFGWTPYDGVEDYHLIVKLDGDTLADVIAHGNSYELEGLESALTYKFNVDIYGYCDSIDSPDRRSAALTATTQCQVVTSLPWEEDFSKNVYASYTTPNCWVSNLDSLKYSYPQYAGAHLISGAYQGMGMKLDYNGTMAIFPEMDVNLAGTELTFMYYTNVDQISSYYSMYYADLILGYVTDRESAATFVALDTLPKIGNYTKYTYTFESDIEGSLALWYIGDATRSTSGGASIDNVKISPKYNLTIEQTENGSVALTSDEVDHYLYGDKATLLATADEHKRFVAWSNGETANPLTITMTSDTTISAIFDRNEFAFSVVAEGGQVATSIVLADTTITEVPDTVIYNTTITLTATPNEHMRFVEWSTGETDETIQVTVVTDTVLTAVFADNEFHVTLVGAEGGTLAASFDATEVVLYGTEVSVLATPADGYVFVKWSNDELANPLTFIVVENVTLSPVFEKAQETGIRDLQTEGIQKMLIDGTIYIIRDGVRYTVIGQRAE